MKAGRNFGIAALLAIMMMIGGCKGTTTTPTTSTTTSTSTTSTTSTTTTIPLDCEANHTAQVAFLSEPGNSVLDVIWDGTKLTTLYPGTTSQVYTVAAGIHTLRFNISGTNQSGCASADLNLVQCKYYLFPCGT